MDFDDGYDQCPKLSDGLFLGWIHSLNIYRILHTIYKKILPPFPLIPHLPSSPIPPIPPSSTPYTSSPIPLYTPSTLSLIVSYTKFY